MTPVHTRVWSWRRWRHECERCRLPWRGKFERCSGQTFEEAHPAPVNDEPAFGWNGDTLTQLPLLTRAGMWRAGGGR